MTTVAVPVSGVSVVDANPSLLYAVGGATINSGAGVYRDIADSLELKALDVTDILTADAYGFLLQGTTDGNGAVVVPSGNTLTGWSGLTQYAWYAFDTGGSLTDDPGTDLAANEYLVWAGFAISTSSIYVNIINTGLQI